MKIRSVEKMIDVIVKVERTKDAHTGFYGDKVSIGHFFSKVYAIEGENILIYYDGSVAGDEEPGFSWVSIYERYLDNSGNYHRVVTLC